MTKVEVYYRLHGKRDSADSDSDVNIYRDVMRMEFHSDSIIIRYLKNGEVCIAMFDCNDVIDLFCY